MPNRTICDALSACRKAYETRNFSYLSGLLEEIQNAANRMESALYDQIDLEYARKECSKLKKDIDKLKKERSSLREDLGKEDEDDD